METFQRNGYFPAGQIHMVLPSERARFFQRTMVRVTITTHEPASNILKSLDKGEARRLELSTRSGFHGQQPSTPFPTPKPRRRISEHPGFRPNFEGSYIKASVMNFGSL